jgi:hypothetical protein
MRNLVHRGGGDAACPSARFPYSIIYYVRGDELRVIALAHHRRRPEYWVRRK